MNGTSYANYAIDNNFFLDNDCFIQKKTPTSKFTFAFVFENMSFGVWFDYANNLCFVSSKFPHNTPYIFSMSLSDHTENTLLIKNYSKYAGLRHFIDFYKKRSSSL